MKVVLAAVLVLLLVGPAQGLNFSGHLKSLNLFQQASGIPQDDSRFSAESLRFDLRNPPADFPAWELSLVQLLLYQHPSQSIDLPDHDVNRLVDLSWDYRSGEVVSGQTQVDRLNLQWQWHDKSLTVGRQAVGFGRISLFSPLDVIAPFSPTAIDNEVRPGVDALRLQYFFGVVGEAGVTLVTADELEKSSALATLTLNRAQTDLLLMGGFLRDRLQAGIGLAGHLGGLGWKIEWSGFRSNNTDNPQGDRAEKFSLLGVEFEYRLPTDLFMQAQYLYNGTGGSRPQDYLLVAGSAPYQEGMSYLVGRHYLLSGLSYPVTPLVDLSSLIVVNLEDRSWLFRPLLGVSLGDNTEFDLFWTHYVGEEEIDTVTLPVLQSEFGHLGESVGFFLRFYY